VTYIITISVVLRVVVVVVVGSFWREEAGSVGASGFEDGGVGEEEEAIVLLKVLL
jgi:hypothetical protein